MIAAKRAGCWPTVDRRSRWFLDWGNWTFGVEYRNKPESGDPLNQFRVVVLNLGPLVAMVIWRAS